MSALEMPVESITKPKREFATPYLQAVAIQRYAMKDIQSDKTTPAARSQLMRAWLEIERLKREIRMKPKPKPVDVSTRTKTKAVTSGEPEL
jgi:hypothetical protein